jgi:hypothetical protein
MPAMTARDRRRQQPQGAPDRQQPPAQPNPQPDDGISPLGEIDDVHVPLRIFLIENLVSRLGVIVRPQKAFHVKAG